jgi:hypothetical protein
MVPMARTPNPRQRAPVFDVHPQTDDSIEVFHADRTLETFGGAGAGWFWCYRQRGTSSDGPVTGPFATWYAAYRHATNAAATQSPETVECWYPRWYDASTPAEYACFTNI